MRKRGGKVSIHFRGDLETHKLLFRTISTVNQLSIYGAVADVCEELAQQTPAHASSSIRKPITQMNEQLDCPLAPEDVTVIMKQREIRKTFRRHKSDSNLRNGWVNEESFSWTNPSERFTMLMDLEGSTGACREFAPRDRDYCEPVEWIRGHEKIGPVIQVKVAHCSEHFGIEIQVKAMMNGSLSWSVISRGTNKYVEVVYEEKRRSVPASANRSRQNNKDKRVHSRVLPPRRSYPLTNGSGMMFLPRMTS